MYLASEYRNREQHEELADRLLRAERAGDVKLAERMRRAVRWLLEMEWLGVQYEGVQVTPAMMATLRGGLLPVAGAAWGPREPRRGIRVLDDFVSAALTTGTKKRIWVHDTPAELIGVRADTDASDRTTGSDIIDINKNGTTIFTTQGNRPTQPAATINDWTVGFPDGSRDVVAGDNTSWDCDQASTGGTGKTGVQLAIAFRYN